MTAHGGGPLLEVYLYAGIASSISILLTLLCAIVLRQALSHANGESVLAFLVALSAGCLSGDAIFHLLPHVFLGETPGASYTTTNVLNSVNAHETDAIWNALPIACTIYAFFLIHLFSENCVPRSKDSSHSHSHSHSHLRETVHLSEPSNVEDFGEGSAEQDYRELISERKESDSYQYPALVWMIVIGDVVHSFTDGIAIGGAYSKSIYGGVSTTVAIICHEVPHGVGDFAVLVTTGLTHRKALFLLTILMLPMYFGMVLGTTLSRLMDFTRIIFAMAAAMFLFISLTELLPGMLNSRSEAKKKSWHLPILHSVGILLGMAAMLGIAVLEGKLSI